MSNVETGMEEAAHLIIASWPRRLSDHRIVTEVEITGEQCPFLPVASGNENRALLDPWIRAWKAGIRVKIYAHIFPYPIPWKCPGPYWQVEKSSVKEIWGVDGGPPKIVCGHIVHVD